MVKQLSRLILIAGKKRSGKDTVASLLANDLQAQGHTAEIYSFANPMKQILATTLGISLKELDNLKNQPTSAVRGYLQRLGTEAIKPIFGEDIWGKLAAEYVHNSTYDYIIIPDFRFPIEAECLWDVTSIQVHRSGLPVDSHVSETALNGYKFDHHIYNNTSLEALTTAVANLLKDIKGN